MLSYSFSPAGLAHHLQRNRRDLLHAIIDANEAYTAKSTPGVGWDHPTGQMESVSKATTPSSADPLIGQSLGGRYKVRRLIGRGGVGLVYLADDSAEDQEVVIKVLSPGWVDDDEAVARFDREASRLGDLRHPNIVAMMDHGREDNQAYLVMEYLQGELLSDYVRDRKQLTVEEFVPIAAQVLKGIGHAHSRELMVRDVKPSNIMLCERKGRANFVKLLDFGLAKLLNDDKPVTEEHVLGTVGYLAPEAIRGETIDLRVDVYAIGVLFYYMLSGKMPFEGSDNEAVFYKTLGEPPPDLFDRLPDGHGVPRGLCKLVHACLEKDPADRPADANAIVEQLIDVVPASMFRLPRAGAPLAPSGAGNTGMVELVGPDASSDVHSAVESSELRMVSSPLPVNLPPREKPQRGTLAMGLVGGAVIAVLGGLVAALMFSGDDPAPAPADAAAAEVSDKGDAPVAAAIEDAQRLIDAGKLDEAADALDRARGLVGDTPELKGKLERTDRALLVAKLMNTAARFEGDGDIASAIGAYRDVIAADPTHAVARARLSRLTARGEGDSGEDGIAYGNVTITAKPTAILFIDGEPMGPTPFKGKLPVGTHKLRMTARGHQPWEGSVEIAEQDNDPIAVRLHGKGWARSKSRSGTAAEDKGATPPAAEPVTSPPPSKPEKKKNKGNGVFLPTKKSDKNDGVFLPTKE